MSETEHTTILRRITGRAPVAAAEVPLTASRAVRLALTRAANDTIGLILSVGSLAEDVQELDALLAGIDDQHMLLGLISGQRLEGLVTLDMQFRAAMLEIQTMGVASPQIAEYRKDTTTDRAMCLPVLARFFAALPEITLDTDFDGWVTDIDIGNRIEDGRAAGLILEEQSYRVLRLSIDLGGEDRTGEMTIALPMVAEPAQATLAPAIPKNWASEFGAIVEEAPAELDALLCRQSVPLATLKGLSIGQVLPLTGCSVHSLRLMSSDGVAVASAKLGQLGGMRAVRVEAPPVQEMLDLSGQPAAPAVGMDGPMMDTPLVDNPLDPPATGFDPIAPDVADVEVPAFDPPGIELDLDTDGPDMDFGAMAAPLDDPL